MKLERSICILIAVSGSLGLPVWAGTYVEQRSLASLNESLEVKTMAEDVKALNAYRGSISILYKVIQSKRNTAQEPVLLAQYAESLTHMAEILFRLMNSDVRNHASRVSEHNSTLNQLLKVENILIKNNYKSSNHARHYFLRARAYKELGQDAQAIKDLKYVLDTYPNSNDDLLNSHFTLYELLAKTRDFKTAIQYLKKIESDTSSPYYAIVLDDLGFSHYSLQEIPLAIEYLEKELKLFPESSSPKQSGDKLERARILKNFALFYGAGMGSGGPQFNIAGFLPALARLNPGKDQNTVIKYFLNLLRSQGMESEIETLKHEVLSSNLNSIDIIEFIFSFLETEVTKKNYVGLRESLDFVNQGFFGGSKIDRTTANVQKFSKLLEDSTSKLQEVFLRSHTTTNNKSLELALIDAYKLLIRLCPPTDKKNQEKFHFNLAEIYLLLKEFELATSHYIWIVNSSNTKVDGVLPQKSPLYDQAKSKIISSRYESLMLKQVFPKEVSARKEGAAPPGSVSAETTEWIGWVSQAFQEKPSDALGSFFFEAARVLYVKGNTIESFKILNQIIDRTPNSRYAVGAASLILDTALVSEKWNDVYVTAKSFITKLPNVAPEFRNKLEAAASESFFKTAEILYQQGHYLEAIKQADLFLKQYPNHKRKSDCQALAGNAALGLKDKKMASTYFNSLIGQNVHNKSVGTAILTQASLGEENFDLEAAVSSYAKYLLLPSDQKETNSKDEFELKKKILLFSWLSGHTDLLKRSLVSPSICSHDMGVVCDKYAAFLELGLQNSSSGLSDKLMVRWRRADPNSKIVWATLSLQRPEALSLNDRLQVVDVIMSDWDHQDSLTRYALLPYLSRSLARTLKQCGIDLRRAHPAALDKKQLSDRTEGIQKLELVAQKFVQLPWARIRAESFHEWANWIVNFVQDLNSLPVPKELAGIDLKSYKDTIDELIAPFVKKGTELRMQALKLSRDAWIESESYTPIAQVALMENPTWSSDFKPDSGKISNLAGYVDLFAKSKMDPIWTTSFNQSVIEKNFLKISYLIQEAQGRKLFKPEQESLAVGLSLIIAGAQSEGLASIKSGIEAFDSKIKKELSSEIVSEMEHIHHAN